MTVSVPREVLTKLKKLALLSEEVKQSRWAVSITRLTILKSLCQHHDVANRFVTVLARRTRERAEEKAKQPGSLSGEESARHRDLIHRAVTALENYPRRPAEADRERLWALYHELAGEQNEHRRVYGGPVRIIRNADLLLVEYALRTVLADEASLPLWAYQTARHY